MIYVLERAVICRYMTPCTKVVVTNLFIFFVFADHIDGFSWWDQWKQHTSATSTTNSSRCDPGVSRPKNQRQRCLQFHHDRPPATAAAAASTTTTSTAATTTTTTTSTASTTKQRQWNRNENESDYKLSTTEYDRKRTLQYVRHDWPG